MKCLPAICIFLFAGCQTPTEAPVIRHTDTVAHARIVAQSGVPDTTTLGGTWWLQPVLPSDTAAGKTPFLVLDLAKSRFSGNTGCNKMQGAFWFSAKDSSLSFSDKMAVKKMACTGYNEAGFLKSLRSAGHYSLHNGMLTLLSDDNTELSHWMRKPNALPKALRA